MIVRGEVQRVNYNVPFFTTQSLCYRILLKGRRPWSGLQRFISFIFMSLQGVQPIQPQVFCCGDLYRETARLVSFVGVIERLEWLVGLGQRVVKSVSCSTPIRDFKGIDGSLVCMVF